VGRRDQQRRNYIKRSQIFGHYDPLTGTRVQVLTTNRNYDQIKFPDERGPDPAFSCVSLTMDYWRTVIPSFFWSSLEIYSIIT